MNRIKAEEPKFIKNVTSLQKILASVAVSMWLVVWAMGWHVIISIFEPDYLKALTFFRVIVAFVALGITSIVGYFQIKINLDRLIELWELYKTLKNEKGEK